MSGSQRVLRVYGVLEIVSAVLAVIPALQGAAVSWLSVASSLLAAYFLLAAAKDASKIKPAWAITLLGVILSVLGVVLVVTAGSGTEALVSEAVALVLNLIVFIAANNVKKQLASDQPGIAKRQGSRGSLPFCFLRVGCAAVRGKLRPRSQYHPVT